MKINKLLVLLMVHSCVSVFAQNTNVHLDLRTKQFDNGSLLPAEKTFNITVNVGENIEAVDLEILKNLNQEPFYVSSWQKLANEKRGYVVLPVNCKLKSASNYAFKVKTYRNLLQADKLKIASQISVSAKSYLQSSIIKGKNGYQFKVKSKEILADLDGILLSSLKNLKPAFGLSKANFSSVLEAMVNNLEGVKYRNLLKDSTDINYSSAFNNINNQIDNEIVSLVNSYSYVLTNVTEVESYATEKTMNFLSLNAGYGAVYSSGSYQNLDYFDGAFVGVSFPLANYALNNSFISKTSFSTGIFLNDFKVTDDVKLTGPLVNRPIYAALGYRFLNFVKVSAGTSILQEKNAVLDTKSDLKFKPFLGLGIELDLWLGLKKQ